MPPLPATPVPARPAAPAGWTKGAAPTQLAEDKQGISAKVVMHHFARGEVRTLNGQAEETFAKVVAKLRTIPEFARMTDAQLAQVIRQITYRLQSADLTINFNAGHWFAAPNHSRSYLQMYERGAHKATAADGRQELRIKGSAMNNASHRDMADTRVTFAANIADKGMQGVARFMQTGGITKIGDTNSYAIKNKQFNPKARQNYAALNYGRMRRGPAYDYGASYLVLRESFKTNALYYIGDTFDTSISAANRATYGTLISLILHAKPMGLTALIDACYRCQTLEGKKPSEEMLEAHIFDEIRFSGGVTAMYLNKMDLQQVFATWAFGDQSGPKPDLELMESNAKIFCHMNGIKLHYQS